MKKNMKGNFPKGEVVIYKTKDGQAKLKVNLREETVWLDAHQTASLFGVNRPAIVKHINNVYKTGELDEKSTCSILEQVAADGKKRKMNLYNLDMIISVGYRVNSTRATQFRIWATKVLRDHIIKGFTLNEKRLKEQKQVKLRELESAIALLQGAIRNRDLNKIEAEGLLKVITDYANSWILLQKYDEGKLVVQKKTSKFRWELGYDEAKKSISELKNNLIKNKRATEIFGQERGHGLDAIIGNLNQTFGGKKLYPSIEQKAAHLLYFVIKDHPFVDGNKRTASFLFILYLARNNYLLNKKGERKINDNALVALALLVAESNPKEKDIMVALITNLL
ncbi:MAG: virulence protein RhuM/Fic/DOC family protein [Parcubacteria group bacterium]|jgi:death-on-curing family protein